MAIISHATFDRETRKLILFLFLPTITVRTLQRELRDSLKKVEQKESQEKLRAKEASIASVLASPDVTPRSAIAMSTIHMFENLSGFKITPKDISPGSAKERVPSVWECEHTGKRGSKFLPNLRRLNSSRKGAEGLC